MTRSVKRLLGFAVLVAGLLAATPARAGSWQNSFAFGATLKGDLYTPTNLASSPAILVAIHMCTGHSSTVHGWFDQFADQNGFYIIAPDAGKQCFDASASRSGDKAAIVTMVNYLITNKGADKNRVFAAGMSSGGCMTNTLLAVYPDVFAGGSAMPGFPAGGWPSGDTTCTKCGSSPPSTDGKYWGDIARKAFAWSGKYPCSQQWVGGGDEYNFNGYLPAVAAQFQNLSNLGSGMTGTGAPSNWKRTVYQDSAGNVWLETNLGPSSQRHDLENLGATLYRDVIRFTGLDKPTGACGLAGGGTGAGGSGGSTGAGGTSGAGGSAATGKGGSTSTGGSGGATGAAGATASGQGGATVNTGAAGTTGAGGATGTGAAGSTGTGVAGSGPTSGQGGTTTSTGAAGSSSTGAAGSSGGNDDGGGCNTGAGRAGLGAIALLLAAALTVTRRRRRAR